MEIAYTFVYPLGRGTAPLVIALLAGLLFGEALSWSQWTGIVVLSAAILSLAWINTRSREPGSAGIASRSRTALAYALLTGLMIAAYTLVDAWGVRQATQPVGFVLWVLFLGGFGFPFLALRHCLRHNLRPDPAPLARRALLGAVLAVTSFGSVILATRLASIGQVAALRETSILFAMAYGVLFLGERLRPAGVVAIILVAASAVLVQWK